MTAPNPTRERASRLPPWAAWTAALAYAAVLVVVTLLPIRWRADLAHL